MLAATALANDHIDVRVVSMPCCERFKAQDKQYRDAVLPKNSKCIAIEAGAPDYWYQFVGSDGAILGIKTFGASAPEKDIWLEYGFTIENVKRKIIEIV